MFGRVVLLLLFQCAECALTSQAIGHLRGGAAPEEAAPKEANPEEAVRKEAAPEEAVPEEAVPAEAVPEEAVPEEAVPEEAAPEEAVPEELKKLSKAEAHELLDSAVKILTGPANKQRLQEAADDAWALPDADEREAMLTDEVLPVAQSMMEGSLQKAGFEESDTMEVIDQIQTQAKGDSKMTEELSTLRKAMKGGGEEDHLATIHELNHPFEDDDYFGNATAAEVSTLVEGEDDDFANTTADEFNKPVEGEDDKLANATADEVNKPVEDEDDDLAKSNAK